MKLAAGLSVLIAAAGVAAQTASNAEKIQQLFGMSAEQFDDQLARRFHYPPPAPPPPTVDDQRAGQALDAAYLESFPDLDRSYSSDARAEAKRKAAELKRAAAGLSHEQFILRVAEIAALADNAHTAIGENAFRKDTPRLPIRTFLFADGLHVLYADPENADLLGARIDRVAGLSLDSVYRRLRRYAAGPERRRRLQLIPVLESPALLHAAGIATPTDRLELTGVLADGRPFQRSIIAERRDRAAWVSNTMRLLFPGLKPPGRELAGIIPADRDRPIYLANSRKLFTLQPVPGQGLYIGLTHNADGDEEKIQPFLDETLTRVRAQKPRFIIVDMRMNGGGDYTTTYGFARALPEAAGTGRIYVLTSPWTFSAGITTVAALKQAGGPRVRIIGEQVGDRLDFWAEGGTMHLPNSGVQVSYAAGRHNYAAACVDRETCFWQNELYPVRVNNLDPDIYAPLTFSDYRNGIDPAMEAVARLERGGERG